MIFYNVEFLSIPKIKYSCAVRSADHNVSVSKNERLIELCYVESGDFVYRTPSQTLVCEGGHIYPLIFSESGETFSETSSSVRMYAIGLECDYRITTVDSEKMSEEDARTLMRELLSGNRLLISREGLSSTDLPWILSYVKKINSCKTGERIGEETRAISVLFELMSRITIASMDAVAFDGGAFPTSAVAYSEMVVAYISQNYMKKISVIDIAEKFGLTPNYLHAIFKQVKGVTIIDYLTAYRMDMAKIYIERFGLRAYEAAQMVGIDDAAYFSRVFKKLYGKSVSEFKKERL